MIKEGQNAPEFELPDKDGRMHRLSDYAGKKLVIYFYPKDNTPGCTKEACSFRDDYSKIKRKAEIIGISADSQASHQRFSDKYGLPFPILSDPEKKVIKAYGAYGKKSLYGKLFNGIIRSTFIIDENGVVIKVFPKVSVSGHSEEVLKFLDSKNI